MKAKIKSIILIVSLVINGLVIFILISSSFSNNSFISFPKPNDNYYSAAVIFTIPNDKPAIFNPIEIDLHINDKFYIQYSIFDNGKQGNIYLSALYDPEIISVVNIPGFGIEITALKQGQTLMQSISSSGITDIANISVYDDDL